MKRPIAHLGVALLVVATPAIAQPSKAPAWQSDAKPVHEGLSSPVGMARDRTGNLYVANRSAGTVLRWSKQGERVVFASGLSGPSGLAVGPSGDILVASYSEDLVWRFTPGAERTVFIRGLATPAGLSFDSRGRLLIANRQMEA